MSLEKLIEQAHQSTLFTAPILEADLSRFLATHSDRLRELAQQAVDLKVKHIYWVGSGNSWCNLFSGKYLLDKFTNIPSDVLPSYELLWRNPANLNQDSWVFLASYSGATEDTVAALRHAKAKGARTIVFINDSNSLMGQESDDVIAYESAALYILPLAAAYIFALEVARLTGTEIASEILKEMPELPSLLGQLYQQTEAPARQLAEQYQDETLFYVLGSGPLQTLAYKFGLTVFMENMRVHGSFIETSEFRHGPAEMLEHKQPTMVFLLGTDESRSMSERVIELAEAQQAKIITFDMAAYGEYHPLLAPFILMVPLQWFAVYSALLRGINDLDERVYMGRGVMAQGEGVTWP
ncbi:MAG: SIS domain-containing protein [Chloroflexota bacterium]